MKRLEFSLRRLAPFTLALLLLTSLAAYTGRSQGISAKTQIQSTTRHEVEKESRQHGSSIADLLYAPYMRALIWSIRSCVT